MKKPAADAIPRIDAGQSQAELLMAQKQGLLTAAPEPSPAPSHASAPAAATAAPGVASSQQGTLDLGIEPPRTVRA